MRIKYGVHRFAFFKLKNDKFYRIALDQIMNFFIIYPDED